MKFSRSLEKSMMPRKTIHGAIFMFGNDLWMCWKPKQIIKFKENTFLILCTLIVWNFTITWRHTKARTRAWKMFGGLDSHTQIQLHHQIGKRDGIIILNNFSLGILFWNLAVCNEM